MKGIYWAIGAAALYGFLKYRAYKGLQMTVEKWQPGATFDGPGFFLTVKIFNPGAVSVGVDQLQGQLIYQGRPAGDIRIVDRFSVAPGTTETVTVAVANLKLSLLDFLAGGAKGLQLSGRARLPLGFSVNFLENVA